MKKKNNLTAFVFLKILILSFLLVVIEKTINKIIELCSMEISKHSPKRPKPSEKCSNS